MKKFLTFALATLGVSMAAHAGFVVEPGIGAQTQTTFQYKFGTTQINYNQTSYPVGVAFKWMAANGFTVGLKADYFMSGTLAKQNSAAAVDDTFTRTVGTVLLGYESAKGFRVWAGYDAMNNITNTPGTGFASTDFSSLSNSGYSAGIGWKFHNHIAVNAQYNVASATPSSLTVKTGGAAGTFSNAAYNSFSDAITSVSLSFPFGSGK